MSRTTTARLKNAVRRLNFALEIVEKSKGEYTVAQIRTNHRVRWALQRDYASGPVAVTGYRPAGDILRHIEAMLDGIAAARGLPVPRSMYDGFIKRDAQVCDNCASPIIRATACVVPALRSDCVSASAGESATLCCRCYGLHEAGAHLICPSCGRACESATTVCDSDDCPWNDPAAPPPSDCCPITGEEYGTGA